MPKIITRKEAQALGLKRFFTGKPCKHGHVCERHVCDRICVDCKACRNRERKRNLRQNPARVKRSPEEALLARRKRMADPAYRQRERERGRKRRADPTFRERQRKRRADPANRERQRERDRERDRKRRADPANRERERERRADPAYRERKREQDRERRADPAFRERERERRADPAFRERERERNRERDRERYLKQKADPTFREYCRERERNRRSLGKSALKHRIYYATHIEQERERTRKRDEIYRFTRDILLDMGLITKEDTEAEQRGLVRAYVKLGLLNREEIEEWLNTKTLKKA
jgi:hypothetical protein